MNALELADWIEDENVVDIMFTPQEHYRGLVATMLRQQAEEINNLKQWQKRYLDVIESLSKDSKQALNLDLRTYDGRLE